MLSIVPDLPGYSISQLSFPPNNQRQSSFLQCSPACYIIRVVKNPTGLSMCSAPQTPVHTQGGGSCEHFYSGGFPRPQRGALVCRELLSALYLGETCYAQASLPLYDPHRGVWGHVFKKGEV